MTVMMLIIVGTELLCQHLILFSKNLSHSETVPDLFKQYIFIFRFKAVIKHNVASHS